MAAITVAMRTEISQLYVSLFGRAPDSEGLGFWVSSLAGGNTIAKIAQSMYDTAPARAYYPLYATPSEVVTTFYTNVLGRAPDAEGLAFWVNEFNNAVTPGTFFAKLISNVVNYSGTDAAGLQSKSLFNNKVAVGQFFGENGGTIAGATAALTGVTAVAASVDTAKTAILNPVVAAQTFTLTTGSDSFTGSSGNDTFNAANAAGTAAGQTFTVSDTLNGGAGTDSLNISVGNASVYALSNVSNIESVTGTFTAAGTLSLLGSSGVTSVTSNGSTAAAIFNNIASSSVGLGVYNTDQNATFTFTAAAIAGTSTAATMTVSNQTAGTTTIAGVENLSIVSTGGANTIGTLTTDAATTLNVSGDQNLTITAALNATVLTVNASTLTGGVTFNADQATAMTITGGAGNDVVTLTGTNAVNDVVNTGAGNDRVVFAANLATTDSVDGGDGTDILMSTSALLVAYTKPATTTVNNFETLRVSDALGGNLTAANVQTGISTVVMDAALAAARTITLEAGSRTVTQTATQAAALTVSDTGTAITDTLTLNITSTVGAVDVLSEELVIGGFETVNINTTTTAAATQAITAITITPDSGGAVALNFSGSNTVTTAVITATSATSGTVNASGLTGSATFTNVGQMVGITSVVGSARNDTIVTAAASTTVDGGAGNDNITAGAGNDNVTGGAGNDTINGAAGNDLIDAGDGIDSITSGAGNDSILGGAGNDTFVFAGDYATGDSIDGGDGTDTLSITTAGVTTLNGYSISTVTALNGRVSNIENLLISDQFNVGAAFDMTRADSIAQITLADGITGDENISGLASGSTVVVNADNNNDADILTLSFADNTGASDVVNYTMTQAATDDYGVLAIAGAETVNLTINEATADATVRTGTLGLTLTSDGTTTRAITLNVSGTEALTIDTAIGATTITTTGLSGAFIMTDTTGSALAQTFTTGSGADTIYGGAGIDTIDTGSGADSIVAGTGADVITGGLGADTIDGGAGSDSITLTEGTASVDRVILNYSGGGTEVDTITGFTTTSTGDNIAISYGAMNLTNTSGLFTSTTSLVNHAGTAIGAAAASTYLRITGATTLETATVLGLGGATFANTDAVEDALEAGGSHVITGSNAAFDVLQNTFAVVYSDGTDTYLALARAAVQTTDDLDFEAGNLVVKNIAKIVGVTSIGSTTFAAGNFDFIA
jgi:hypothetical protein